jgi:hypothetical protein
LAQHLIASLGNLAEITSISSILRDQAYLVQDAARLDETFPGWREHPSLSMESILNLNPPERRWRPVTRSF